MASDVSSRVMAAAVYAAKVTAVDRDKGDLTW
jgi:hypothetical protein